jgi:hypothetical protein
MAPILVRTWIELTALHDIEEAKLTEAYNCAYAMEQWHTRKWPD